MTNAELITAGIAAAALIELDADMEAALADSRLAMVREDEYFAARDAASDSFAAYWAGSASASVLRDYRAGRVVNV